VSSVEEQLVQEIAAVTREIVVTDAELLEARQELSKRIDTDRRWSRVLLAAGLAAAAAVIAVAGVIAVETLGGADARPQPLNTPSAPSVSKQDADWLIGDPPTTASLNGVWRVDDDAVLMRFSEDGRVWFSDRGRLYGHPSTMGTYEVAGYEITITTTNDADSGCVGQKSVLRASMFELGILRYAFSGDTDCAPVPYGRQDLEQALPTSEALIFRNENGWRPLPADTELDGDFIAEGGGYILELNRGGDYFVASAFGDVVDRGRWNRQARTLTLTTTTSAGTPTCAEGSKLVLRGLETLNPGTVVFRGRTAENTCNAPWTPTGWLLIPDGSP
jgi:hypothetical protein